MKSRSLGFLVKEAWLGMRKNSLMSIASIITVCLSMFLLAVMLLLALNLQYIAQTIESQVELVAYLDEDSTLDEQNAIKEQIERIQGVESVNLITEEQALQLLREQFGDQASLLDGIERTNALRASLRINVPNPEHVDAAAQRVQAMTGVSEVRYEKEVLNKLFHVTSAMRTAGLALVLMLAVGTLFIISNTVRITVFARRHEIGIMKLVGATDSFIRFPFLLEGAILGLCGSLIAFCAIVWGYERLTESIKTTMPFLPVLTSPGLFVRLAEAMLGLGALIGIIGSGISVRRYLRV